MRRTHALFSSRYLGMEITTSPLQRKIFGLPQNLRVIGRSHPSTSVDAAEAVENDRNFGRLRSLGAWLSLARVEDDICAHG